MTHRRHTRLTDALAITSIILVTACVLAGCTSTAARNVRHDWAVEKKTDIQQLAKAHLTKDRTVADDQLARELAAKDDALRSQNANAGEDVDKVAQNYIDYFKGIDDLKTTYLDDYTAAQELYDAAMENAEAPTTVSDMADKELTVAKQAGIDTLNAAKDAAVKLYTHYQETHTIPTPTKPGDPAPTPTPTNAITNAAQIRHK